MKFASPKSLAVPQLVREGSAKQVRATATGKTLQLSINLPLRNEDALDALLAEIYNPASPKFHKYLSPREFDRDYGPTKSDFDTLVTWAQNNALTVKVKSSNLRILTVEGSVYAVNRALHVTMTDYQDMVKNRAFFAPDREPTLDVGIPILGIDGLDNATPPYRHYRKGSAAEIARAKQAVAGSGPAGEYLPSDMRAAYYGSGPLTGAGQTVGIFSFDGYLPADLGVYYSQTGTTQTVPLTNVLVGGFSGGCVLDTPCDDGEQILDIMQVQGMAPGLSQILFYENGSTANVILNQMVTDNTAKVISSSWGGGGFGTSSDTYFKQMATQGQTFLNATGDSGAFNRYTYLAPSVDPYIVQVGGTSLTTSGKAGPWASEVSWAYSGGGFYGTTQPIPAYQTTTGVITSANGGSKLYRNSPDIAAEADFDNPTVSNGLLDGGYGGTSFAAPRYAGYMALANQQSVANGTGYIGFPNTALYTLGLNSNSANYHDITSGSNPSTSYSGTTGTGAQVTYNAVAGYDLVTGWGSPNGPGLINSLAGTAYQDFAVTPATTSMLNLVRSSSVSDTLTLTDYNGFAAPVTFAVSGLPSGVTASFSPATVAAGSTSASVTFTADATPVFQTTTITVTATSGTLTHSFTYTINVFKRNNADFTITATSPVSLPVGGQATSAITVSEGSGLPAPVKLTVSGLPTGVTASFSTTSTSSTSVLTFVASSSAVPGTTYVTVTGTYPTVTLTHSAVVALTVVLPGTQLLQDPGFESSTAGASGTVPSWTVTSSTNQLQYLICTFATCGVQPHSGNYYLSFDGYGGAHTDTAKQTVTIPAGYSTATLSFYLGYATAETSSTKVDDTFTVQILNSSGTVISTVATLSNLTARTATGYTLYSYALPASVIGQTVTVQFTGTENSSLYTEFFLDDVSLNVQ